MDLGGSILKRPGDHLLIIITGFSWAAGREGQGTDRTTELADERRSGDPRNGEKKGAAVMNVGKRKEVILHVFWDVLSTVYPESRIRIGMPKPTKRQ